ncbi:hypothetical protein ASPWEDRAFT_39325 [Aspergillus wentii DTO 134E9]|uniref:Aromatic amino acid beta-eliminating lyase/threonine aldolase domain-containing protein n=1 Tax=Aspergillus wentii DTO 134E9 TaxID=1073089 RepID=A0A1L9RRL4_ASPWE|nr:uncharacterized protein ASPWEDRAFT_39325 [Aspergillus wentii DTO 134E9]KAI9930442.1 hypothetical protein MW887_011196 [Aspergillus wentii]OJJ37600.1 hypothetical protein ASPWEDRAFT_39325 [Aspergillus wentii DTO 134E9]
MAPSLSDVPQLDAVQKLKPSGDEPTFRYTSTEKLKNAVEKAGRDFRSDVVTVPTESMMQAIIDASVGDDIYDEGGDASVNALQDKMTELSGKEAALWTLSGTQGNQICLRTHLTQPPHSVLVDHRAHVQCWESGALPVFSQASVKTVQPKNGIHLTLEDVKNNMIPDGNIHFPPTRVVSLENTLSGTILPLKDAQEISEFVRNYPVPDETRPIRMHLDGARLFDAVAAEGVSLKDYCACFDSISFCLAKGIGAPQGSVIVGSRRFIERAKWYRKMFGGGTRQPGMMAACASAALDNAIPLLPGVHAMAKEVARKLEEIGYVFALPVQSNMVVLDLEAMDIPHTAFVKYCKQYNAIVFSTGRLVFHQQTSQDGVSRLLQALEKLIEDKKAGKELASNQVTGGCT